MLPNLPTNLSGLDLSVIVLVLLSMGMGAWRGLVYEVLSISNWVVAFLVARFCSDFVTPYTATWEQMPQVVRVGVVYGGLFLVSLFIGSWLSSRMREWISHSGLRPADRTLGALFGVVRAVVIGLAVTVLVHTMGWNLHEIWQSSVLATGFDAVFNGLKPWLGESINQVMN